MSTLPSKKPKRSQIFSLRGFQARYVALVLGSLLVLLLFAGMHAIFMAQSVAPGEILTPLSAALHKSSFQFFGVGLLYVFIITVAAVFLSHRLAGPTQRIEEELMKMASDGEKWHPLHVREGDDFEELVKAINLLMEKKGKVEHK